MIVESYGMLSTFGKPFKTWGSNATYIPSSSSLVMTGTVRFGNDQIARIIKVDDYQLAENIVIHWIIRNEGLGQ
ncbi:hypothetical protein Tco_0420429 [Tanacetum coccineum]